MRKLTSVLLIALVSFVGIGCDSNDDPTAAEKLVGTWALTGVSDAEGDASAAFAAAFNSVTLTNAAAGTFTINVDPVQGADQAIPGTYTVTEANSGLTLLATVGTQSIPLNFTYSFVDDNTVRLTSDASTAVLLNTLFGTTLSGQAVITVSRVV